MLNDISILTLTHNRDAALANLLRGVARGSVFPKEVIIVHMNEEITALEPYPFPVHQFQLSSTGSLNLSAARNFAFQQSKTEFQVFLDVDCIPAADLLAHYQEAFSHHDGLISGRVRYLGKEATADLRMDDDLFAISSPDPVRGAQEQFTYALFWSLNFGCSQSTFNRIGGFDVAYTGYGGEDTDFAFTAEARGVPLTTIDATAFHQYHSSYSPPLNHLEEIVYNAQIFASKWKKWPMQGWLDLFEQQGYVVWHENKPLIVKLPTEEELASALKC